MNYIYRPHANIKMDFSFLFYLWTKNFVRKYNITFMILSIKLYLEISQKLTIILMISIILTYRSPFILILFLVMINIFFSTYIWSYGVYVWWKVNNTEKLEMIRFMNLYKRQTKHIKKKHVSSNVKHHHLYLLPFFCLFFFPRKVVITYR